MTIPPEAKIDGNIVSYECCAESKDAYDNRENKLDYLGVGTIYSVEGVLQTGIEVRHFWKNKISRKQK